MLTVAHALGWSNMPRGWVELSHRLRQGLLLSVYDSNHNRLVVGSITIYNVNRLIFMSIARITTITLMFKVSSPFRSLAASACRLLARPETTPEEAVPDRYTGFARSRSKTPWHLG